MGCLMPILQIGLAIAVAIVTSLVLLVPMARQDTRALGDCRPSSARINALVLAAIISWSDPAWTVPASVVIVAAVFPGRTHQAHG